MTHIERLKQELHMHAWHNEWLRVRADDLKGALDDRENLLAAVQAILKITDGSQPIDYPGALMVARSAIAKATGVQS